MKVQSKDSQKVVFLLQKLKKDLLSIDENPNWSQHLFILDNKLKQKRGCKNKIAHLPN